MNGQDLITYVTLCGVAKQFPTMNPKWTRAAVDKFLANKKYIPIVGVNVYMDAQFEKDRRCNVDYDKAGHPRKSTRYQSSSTEME